MNVIRNIFARHYAGFFLLFFQHVAAESAASDKIRKLKLSAKTINYRRKKTRACGFLLSLRLSLKQR
jgi:hypothetical protein